MANRTVTSDIPAQPHREAKASDGVHVLRLRYRAACKDFQRAKRAVHGCLNPRRLPVLKEKFERARLHLKEVESEVKRCW